MTEEVEVKVKRKPGRPKGPNKATILEAQLKELQKQIEQLTASYQPKEPTPAEKLLQAKRLAEAEAELAALRPGASLSRLRPKGPPPQFVPYKGLVRAREDCAVGAFREGPHPDKGKPHGDVFAVDVPVLWSDDPYEPVRCVNTDELNPRYERDSSVPVVDARWRPIVDPETFNMSARAM